MVRFKFDSELVKNNIDSMVRKTMTMDLNWDWPCGVAYYGVSAVLEHTRDEEYLQLLRNRVDEHIRVGLPTWNVNACAMGHCLITLHDLTGEQKYLDLALSKIDYLKNKALRFADNVLQHTVSAKNDFPEQAWADTLFMAAYFMLRMGAKLDDKALIDDALNQFYWHIHFLQDPQTGLWYHGYNNINKDHMSGFFWARANAWAAYTMSRVKIILPEWYLFPQAMDIECSLRDQLAGIKALQTENGLWHTVLDDEASYEELSACSGIAAAMLTPDANPLHTPYVEKAYGGIMKNISADGRLLNVSGGTAVMRDLEGYRNISRKWTQGWGQGLCLAFLVNLLKYAAVPEQPGTQEN